MTKAELIAAIADAPDDAEVYRDDYGFFRSAIDVDVLKDGSLVVFTFAEETEEEAA